MSGLKKTGPAQKPKRQRPGKPKPRGFNSEFIALPQKSRRNENRDRYDFD